MYAKHYFTAQRVSPRCVSIQHVGEVSGRLERARRGICRVRHLPAQDDEPTTSSPTSIAGVAAAEVADVQEWVDGWRR